ncbi:MAG: hypothetical protein WCS01_06415 [bacterium]
MIYADGAARQAADLPPDEGYEQPRAPGPPVQGQFDLFDVRQTDDPT